MHVLNKSIWTGLIFSVVGVGYYVGTMNIRTTARYGVFGGAFMPRVYAVALIICALVQLLTGIRQLHGKSTGQKVADESLNDIAKGLLTFVLLFLYIVAMKPVGFIISSICFLFCLALLLVPSTVKRSPVLCLKLAAFSAILSVATFLFFKKVVFMALPSGTLLKGIMDLL